MNKFFTYFLTCLILQGANSQQSQSERDSIARLSALDHSQMKEQLGIKMPNRPGPSGNPEAPNTANYDESQLAAYSLPNPLIMHNGEAVRTVTEWQKLRQPELVEDFEREMYGRLPDDIPPVRWKVVGVKDTMLGSYPVREKMLRGVADNSQYPEIQVVIELLLATPSDITGPVPVVTEIGFVRRPFGRSVQATDNPMLSPAEPGWKQQLISRGWGYAILNPISIQADHGAGLRQGIIGLVNKGEHRKPMDWGVLRAWAWGASRAIDYYETDPAVDTKKLAIEGLSRYGKAALLAMAFEPRFSLGFIGSSGAGGAKILRRNFGEQVENLAAAGEYHWFCGNFIKYASSHTANDLPVDAHQLIALCAPRPVFISSGSPQVEGQWVDARGMFIAGVHAGPVYELFGKEGLGTSEFPEIGVGLVNGEIAFRQHSGGHSTGPNWSTWIGWACRYWGPCLYFR